MAAKSKVTTNPFDKQTQVPVTLTSRDSILISISFQYIINPDEYILTTLATNLNATSNRDRKSSMLATTTFQNVIIDKNIVIFFAVTL